MKENRISREWRYMCRLMSSFREFWCGLWHREEKAWGR